MSKHEKPDTHISICSQHAAEDCCLSCNASSRFRSLLGFARRLKRQNCIHGFFKPGKWYRNHLGRPAPVGQPVLAGRAARKGEPPERAQTPCSHAMDHWDQAAQAATVAPTFARELGQLVAPTPRSDHGQGYQKIDHEARKSSTPIVGAPVVGTSS